MKTIDADAHVIETPRTWSYMGADEQEFRPQIFVRDAGDGAPHSANQRNDYWKIGDNFQTKTNVGDDVPAEARDLVDIQRRLDHMDRVNVDIQVLFPTIYLRPITNEHDREMALARSYNRWLADIWKQSGGRLRWVAIPPLLSLIDPARVRAELEFCKEHGAVGVFMRGLECEQMATHRYFFPLYRMAEELDLAITFHTGNNSFANHDSYLRDYGLMIFKFPVMGAFCYLLSDEIPKRFPALRWAFIEASAQWVPYMLGEVRIRLGNKGIKAADDIMGGNNFYVTTQKSDDLPFLVGEFGDDNIIIGTDYGHKDASVEIEALQRMAGDGNVPAKTAQKILTANPARLYGIN